MNVMLFVILFSPENAPEKLTIGEKGKETSLNRANVIYFYRYFIELISSRHNDVINVILVSRNTRFCERASSGKSQ